MKKAIMTAAILSIAATAFANGPFTNKGWLGITNTKHDLSSTSPFKAADAMTQKCIFCHTPHNPARNVPLSNRNDITATFQYYASPTLSAAATKADAPLNANSVSAMCMSCHDGATAMGAIKNTVGISTAFTNNGATITTVANLGTDLRNDHPVAFDYQQAAGQDFGGLYEVSAANAKLGQNAFFAINGTGTGTQMECASCHKVHDDRIAPFLRITNAASELCLACHIK